MTAEVPRGRGAHARTASSLRLVWVYPDLLSTYGDRGNLLILQRRARLRGIEVEQVLVNADQAVPRQGDIYLLGGGEDLPQILAARRLRADRGLYTAAEQGAVIFAVCAGYQLLGTEFGGEEGQPVAGLEILDIRSGRGERRGVGEILGEVNPALQLPQLTGFENHQGVTRGGPGTGHLPARPGASPQPGPGRPAAHLGGRAAATARGPRGAVDAAVARPAAGGCDRRRVTRTRRSVDQGLGGIGGHLGDERRCPGDPHALNEVPLGDATAGGTLGAQGHGATGQDAREQVIERRRVIQHHLGRAPGQ